MEILKGQISFLDLVSGRRGASAAAAASAGAGFGADAGAAGTAGKAALKLKYITNKIQTVPADLLNQIVPMKAAAFMLEDGSIRIKMKRSGELYDVWRSSPNYYFIQSFRSDRPNGYRGRRFIAALHELSERGPRA